MTNPRKRDAYVSFWCSPELREEIGEKATGCGMGRSDYIRSCMAAAVDSPYNVPPRGRTCDIQKDESE